MPLRPRSLAAVLLVPALTLSVLAGCGSDDETGAGGSSEPTATAAPAATATAPNGVTVVGAAGEKPTVTVPETDPPAELQTEVLTEGTGDAVAVGDVLVGNYLGQVWADGTVFDNSWDRGELASFPIGVGKVIPGWDEALVGQKAGSRVLLTIPPDKGYGKEGQPQGGIPGDATLVFVVDVAGSVPPTAGGQDDATAETLPEDGPQVSGPLGAKPTVTVPEGAPEPTEPTSAVVATGTGPQVEAGQFVVMQYEVVDWTGKAVESTWTGGAPFGGTVGREGQASPFDELVGQPVGSRVLVTIPAQQAEGGATPAFAVAIDIVEVF